MSRSTLFSPLTLGRALVPNRIAMAAMPSGAAARHGRVTKELASYYLARARAGVGAVVFEPAYVRPPRPETAHLGLYDDRFVAGLRLCIAAIHLAGAGALVMLDQPLEPEALHGAAAAELGAAFVAAAWRAHSAGADGIMLSTCEAGPFAWLLSPLQSRGAHRPAGLDERLWLLLNVVEGVVRWLGPGFLVGVRLVVEEFAPGGIALQDARVIAVRLVSAGVGLLEIGTRPAPGVGVAQFPGWKLPLAAALRAVVDVPILVGGQLDDPWLADSAVRDGSADLIDVAERLHAEPTWALRARDALATHPRS